MYFYFFFFSSFLLKFIFSAYKRTFISVIHKLCNIGCLKQTGKNMKNAVTILIVSNFFQCKKNTFNLWDMLMQIILEKLIVCYRIMPLLSLSLSLPPPAPPKKNPKKHRLVSSQNTGKIKRKQEGHEALNRSPEYTGQSQTFNFEI